MLLQRKDIGSEDGKGGKDGGDEVLGGRDEAYLQGTREKRKREPRLAGRLGR